MKRSFVAAAILLALPAVLTTVTPRVRAEEGARKPNVLLVVTDDQGYGEFGFTGNQNVLTPNMDKLAKQSAVFSNFIVAPACSAAKISRTLRTAT